MSGWWIFAGLFLLSRQAPSSSPAAAAAAPAPAVMGMTVQAASTRTNTIVPTTLEIPAVLRTIDTLHEPGQNGSIINIPYQNRDPKLPAASHIGSTIASQESRLLAGAFDGSAFNAFSDEAAASGGNVGNTFVRSFI